MSHETETFFTTIGCMDGRVQDPIAALGRNMFSAQHPDTITEAGLVGKLIGKYSDKEIIESVRFKLVEVSLGKHNSRGVIVHGHQECAGNPVGDEKHIEDIRKSGEFIRDMIDIIGSDVPVVDVFVHRQGNLWVAKKI